MAKLIKTRSELVEYFWKTYPDSKSKRVNHENYLKRTAMLEAHDFLTGKIDQREWEQKKLADEIYKKIMNNQ